MTEKTKSYKGYLIDLDGTLYKGNESIPHAKEFVAALREKNIPFFFLTNNSTTIPAQVAERLRVKFGIEADEAEVYTSALAAADYLKERGGGSAFVVGEDGLKKAVAQAGLSFEETNPDYVIAGLYRTLTYEELAKGALAIRNGAQFILTNADATYPTERGLLPGAGSIGALLSTAAGVKPTITGKPEKIMMEEAIKRLGVKREEVLMVGDNLDTDIRAGLENGLDTLMVLTGVSTESQAKERGILPTYIRSHLGKWEIK